MRIQCINRRLSRRTLLVALGCAWPLSVVGSPAPQRAPLNIYVPGSHTGVVPFVAADILNAVKVFAAETNASGGLQGRTLNVIVQDDKADLELAENNARVALADPNHFLTVGHNFSRIALPVGKMYAQHGKLFFTPFATNSQISKIGKTVFQLCYNDTFQEVGS